MTRNDQTKQTNKNFIPMKRLLTAVAALFLIAGARAQINPMEPMPADPAVRHGKLANGMNYYIRHNEKPKGQADFYIEHYVGAIQENDAQQGLAHFLEHMAFNGTKNLRGKEMIDYFERIGVKFGSNLNAYTTQDNTQYSITDVPTTRQGIIDTALLVLHDWSHFIALEPAEIDSERGVIMEELRTRDGARFRSQQAMIKALANGTKYEHRNVIGYLDGLKSFSHDNLADFYHTWYRPDYQVIVIVGDIDVDKVEADLVRLMADIPAPAADAPQKETIVVPDNDTPIVSIYTDPEMNQTNASIFIKRPAMPREANGLVLREMQNILILYGVQMLNARLGDIAMQPDAPFLSASVYDGNIGIIPTLTTTVFSLTTQDGKLPGGFDALLTEMEKSRRFGFTEGEFERTKNELMRYIENQYAARNDRRNGSYVTPLIDNFKFGTAYCDAEYEYRLDSTLLEAISLADINMAWPQLLQPRNWVVVVNAPEKEGLTNPTESDLLAAIERSRNAELEAYEDTAVKEPLIPADTRLKGSAVKKEQHNEAYGTTEWTLKNGARIIVKPTKFKADEVYLAVKSRGGLSLLPDEEYYAAKLLPGIMQMSGLGKFTATDLRKQLAGKQAQTALTVNGYNHGMYGEASPRDLETLLQLVYLSFTSPRFDETDYNTYMTQMRAQVANMLANPDYIVQDAFKETVYGNNYREQMLSPEILDDVRFEQLRTVYDKLYTGANNFTFTFVGDVDPAVLKPLVERYIGSLPATKKTLDWADDGVAPVKGVTTNDFRAAMLQPKVSVWYNYSGDLDFTIENRLAMSFLEQVLTSRYRVSVREEKGGTYGVGVGSLTEYAPKNSYRLIIQFDTNEQMADELMEIIVADFRRLAAEGPKAEEMENIREYMLKEWTNSLEENGSWLTNLDRYYSLGLDYVNDYEEALRNLTAEDVRLMAGKVLKDNNLANVIMRPAADAE